MMRSGKGLVLQDLDRLFRRGTVPSGDGALLDSFLSGGDESAFEALVGRHGPMVRGVCRRLLASVHDADDAFQATFLVLVRKGRRLRDPDRLGPWLHGVATREALKARAARREGREVGDVPCREGADARSDAEWSDVMPIIDAELARLPAKHREVLVACLLDGATVEEASRRLDCPVGTVKSRLSRAREALKARLTSRGVAPAVAVAVLSADASTFASPVSSTLIRATLKATAAAAAPGVASFFTGVAPAMISKSTLSALVVVGLGVAGVGAAAWNPSSQAQQTPGVRPRPAQTATTAGETDEARRQARNFREILLAATNYATQKGAYPSPAIQGEGDRPLLSWRVAILPFLGQNELYQQFHLDEPWDSPHNKTLIDRMPAVFETPAAPAPRGQTRFRGLAGNGSLFDPSHASVGRMMGGMMGGPDGMMGMGPGMMMGMAPGGRMPGKGPEGMMGMGPGGMMGEGPGGMPGMGPGGMMGKGRGGMMPGMGRGGMMPGMGRGGMMPGMMKARKGTEKEEAGQVEEEESDAGAKLSQRTDGVEAQEDAQADDEPKAPAGGGTDRRAFRPGMRPGAAGFAGGRDMWGMMSGMMSGMGPASTAAGRRGVGIPEIVDGTSNTVFAVVARDATPWTKPGELPFVPGQDLPALDDHDPRGYILGMCDGSVRRIRKDHPNLSILLPALITRNGGEVVPSDVFSDVERPAAVVAAASVADAGATSAAPSAPTVEDRLRAVEEKLERLLKRLEEK